jgi:hypothetical protein
MRSISGLAPVLLSLLLVAGCASSQKSARAPEAGAAPTLDLPNLVADDTALVMIHRLEAEPLADDAAALRATLFTWVVGTKSLQGFSAPTTPIDRLAASASRYRDELMMQYIFGAASYIVGSAPGAVDPIEGQSAGIRSMIAAYRNMLQSDPSLRDPFLDSLDDIRRRGDLREYVRRFQR